MKANKKASALEASGSGGPPPRPESLWTCQQGAEYLAISLASFWHRCRSGEIPHIRLSARCYRVRRSDLDEYLRKRMR
jgi:excisionase family DNA binding protein